MVFWEQLASKWPFSMNDCCGPDPELCAADVPRVSLSPRVRMRGDSPLLPPHTRKNNPSLTAGMGALVWLSQGEVHEMEGKSIFRGPGYSTCQLPPGCGASFQPSSGHLGFPRSRDAAAFSNNCSAAAPSTEVQAKHSSLSQSFGRSLTLSLIKQIILGSQSSLLTEWVNKLLADQWIRNLNAELQLG